MSRSRTAAPHVGLGRAIAALAAALGSALVQASEQAPDLLPAGPSPVETLPGGLKRPHQDQWFTDETHQRRQGTIVFSRERIENPHENEALFSAAFGRREPLYGRVYLDRAVVNTPVFARGRRPVFPAESAHFYRLFVDGKPFDRALGVFTSGLRLSSSEAEDRQLTTWRFEPHPSPLDDRAAPEVALAWARAVNALEPGRHRVRIELWAGELDQHSAGPRAAGELTLAAGAQDFLGSGVQAPVDGYGARDRDQIKQAIQGLLARARPPVPAERLALARVWAERALGEPGAPARHILAIARTAGDARGKVCEYRGFLVRQERARGRWGPMELEPACALAECAPFWADCE